MDTDKLEQMRTVAVEVLTRHGVELVEMKPRREGADDVVRFIIDRPDGVTLDLCGEVNRALRDAVTVDAALGAQYVVEVASLGLDRPLVTQQDFNRMRGQAVQITLHDFMNHRQQISGIVDHTDTVSVTLRGSNNLMTSIKYTNIATAQPKLPW